MASQEEIKAVRLKKIELLKEAGMEAYPAKIPRDFCLRDAKKNFAEYEKTKKSASVAGRVMAIRGQGAIFFVVLYDGRGKFQVIFKKDTLNERLFKLFKDAVDVGDFVSVTGTFFKTERGEESVLATTWTMAAKSPATSSLPSGWSAVAVTLARGLMMNEVSSDPSLFMRARKLTWVGEIRWCPSYPR